MTRITRRHAKASGDSIRNKECKQVIAATADGCIAAMSIEKFLNNRKNIKVNNWIQK